MLCSLCETLLTNILHRDIATWKRLSGEQWYTFKHGNYHTVLASATAGCQLCRLFNDIRRQRIRGLDGLAEKWHSQNAMLDVQQSSSDGPCVFQLLTEAPERSWIPFELFRPTFAELEEHDVVSSDLALPVQVSPEAVSDRAIGIARRWIDRCQYNHSSCTRDNGVRLPTRVIDVRPPGQHTSARLYDSSAHGQHGHYVTLSHCWGEGRRLTTTKHNIKDFHHAIPFEQLPRTFQDAITLTRMLGMRYLWLDALCIIQDDQDDWRRESAAMCAVYENAAFSLSAVSAPDSDAGLFNRRNDGFCVATVDGTLIGIRPQLDSLHEALQHSRLESRAWCMQERILAPAILHIGPQQLYWECRAGEFSESYPDGSPSPNGDSSGIGIAKHSRIPSNASRAQLLDIWYNLVSQYSARNLTKPSDRLPAIGGLADRLTRELGDSSVYCHGLWADDFVAGLLWQRPIHRHKKLIPSRDHYSARLTHTPEHGKFKYQVAPSWSWAAVRGAVNYSWRELHHVAGHCLKHDLSVKRLSRDDSLVRVSGYIRRGACRPRERELADRPGDGARVGPAGNASFKASGSHIVDEGVLCILDDPDDVIPKSCYCLRVSSWSRAQSTKPKRHAKTDAKIFYLVLERSEAPVIDHSRSSSENTNFLGKFRRIGMGYDDQQKAESVFLNAERHTIELA